MNRSATLLLLTLLVLPIVKAEAQSGAPSEQTATSQAEADRAHPLWVLSDDDNTVYLMGSVHLLRPDAYPLAPEMESAFTASEAVTFEINLDSMQAAMGMFMQRGMYQDDRTIESVLADTTYQRLTALFDSLGVPAQNMAKMKPWMLGITLPTIVMQRGGYDAASGLDMHFYQKAKEAGKPVSGLETFEEQVRLLESLGGDDPNVYLATTLDQLDGVETMMETITTAWQTGDVETVAATMNESMEDYPEMRERMLVDRNRNWIPQIEAILDGDTDTLIVVGLGHLVGEDSVIAMLRARGYTPVQR